MKTVDLKSYNNSWYNPGPKWKAILWFLVNPITINSYIPLPQSIKKGILRLFGTKIDTGVVIKPKLNIKYPWFLEIGKNSWIGEEVWIDNLVQVKIGQNVCISQGAMLLTGNHNFNKSNFDLIVGEIEIENGSWIGAKSIVCPGIKMRSHSMLTAGSILTRETEEYGIYSGNPAIFKKKRVIS